MFKITTTLALALLSTLANAQVSERRNVSDFTKIEITDGISLTFTSGTQSLTATAADGLGLSSIMTNVENGTLKISCKGNGDSQAAVYISSDKVVAMEASKNAQIKVLDEWDAPQISVRIASGSSFNGKIRAEKTNLAAKSNAIFNTRIESSTFEGNFESGAKANLSGNAATARIITDGNALCNAKNLMTRMTTVRARGISTVAVYAKEKINAQAEDSAVVTYFGKPGKVAVGENNMSQAVAYAKIKTIKK